jgi:hypothetical protein
MSFHEIAGFIVLLCSDEDNTFTWHDINCITPSGDDLLVGYLAGLWCAVLDNSERAQFVANLGKAVVRLSRRTTDISRAYLYHAARGQVSSRLADLAEAICRGENLERISMTVESAMQVGHTSGMDVVTGLLIGLVIWTYPTLLIHA